MATKSWTILDTATNAHVDELALGPENVGGTARGYSISKRTLRGGVSEGVDAIRVDNGKLAFEVLPTRGMGIWKAWLNREEIGWRSPVRGPVHPNFVPCSEPGGLGWLEGFDELLVRCGLESNGAPEFGEDGRLRYPLHGRIANRPAHRVDVEVDNETGRISVTGEVDETRFLFHTLSLRSTVSTQVGESKLQIRDEIINRSKRPASAQLLYHINFGLPLLDPGAEFRAPVDTVAPRDPRAAEGIESWTRYAEPLAGYAEQVYFMELRADASGQTLALLRNADGSLGVSLRFNNQQLPCFALWKNTAAIEDGYVTGLEPATNFPNPHSFEQSQDRVIKLAPLANYEIDLQLEVHSTAAEVAAVEREIQTLQGDTPPDVHTQPHHGWCR
jgi:galactose mutarotase-like enzyme